MRKDDLMKYYEPLMRGYSVLDVETERPFSISLNTATYGRLGDEKHAYEIKKDRHIAPLFKPLSPDIKHQQKHLRMTALCIVSNLCRFSLDIPDHSQLRELIQLSAYSPEEWNNFGDSIPYEVRSCFFGQNRQPAGIILYITFFDFLCEDAKALSQDQKKRRNSRGGRNAADRFYSGHFRSIVNYLYKNELLHFMTLRSYPIQSLTSLIQGQLDADKDGELLNDSTELYEEAVKRYGELVCHKRIFSAEVTELKKQRVQEWDRIVFESERQTKKTLQDGIRSKAKKQAPFINAAFPQPSDLVQPQLPTLFSSLHSSGPGPEGDLIQKTLMKASDALDEKLRCLIDYENAVVDKARSENAAVVQLEAKYLRDDFAMEIAESAFLAILLGDEIYKTEIGYYMFRLLSQNSCMPTASNFTPDLEDEDDWDYLAFPGDNGKLENVVLGDADTTVFRFEELEGLPSAVKFGSVVAEYAECQVVLPIAIRKSQVKAFRKMGCSERKARDYALIAATLRSANWQDSMEIEPVQYFPDASGTPRVMIPEDRPANPSDELDSARKNMEEAQRQRKAAERESQTLRHEVAKLRRELEQTKIQLERSNELLELYESRDEEPQDEPTAGNAFQFPFETDLRIVLYGGFHSFHQDILKLIPGLRIIPSASRIDVTPVRNADIVFIQINKTSHSNYWNVCDTAKAASVPYYHLNYAGPRRCAEEIIQKVRELDGIG